MKVSYIKKLSPLMTALLLISCADPVKDKHSKQDIVVAPKTKDSIIDLSKTRNLNLRIATGNVTTASYFDFIDSLDKVIQDRTKNSSNSPATEQEVSAATATIQDLYMRYYNDASTHTKINFSQSPYADFIIAKSKGPYLDATKDIDNLFNAQLEIINEAIDSTTRRQEKLADTITISQAFNHIVDFLTQFEGEVKKSKATDAVKDGIVTALYQRFWLKLPAASSIVRDLESSTELKDSVEKLRSLITEFNVNLEQKEQEKIQMAADLAESLDQNLSAKSAFIVLVELWDDMTPAEREETFGQISPELHEYLSTKNKKQIDCLKQKECSNLVLHIQKKFFILPDIKEYGVSRLQNEIKNSALTTLNTEAVTAAKELIVELPNLLKTQLLKGMTTELTRFKGYRDNYEEFIRDELQTWFQKTYMRSQLPALESDRVNITNANSVYEIKGPANADNTVRISAEALGAALKTNLSAIDKSDIDSSNKNFGKLQLFSMMRVNQILAHGGFSLADKKPYQSMTRTLFNARKTIVPMNVETTLQLPSLFAMPSPLSISGGYDIPTQVAPKDISVRAQAKLLAGFTSTLNAFRDWDISIMDKILGPIQAKDLLVSLPAEKLKIPAFQKEAILALALGNASAILSNLKAEGTPLLIFCGGKNYVWADKNNCELAIPTPVTALVDIKNTLRSDTVQTVAQAEFLLSLIDFIITSQNLMATKSEFLVKSRDPQSPSPIAQLKKSLPLLQLQALTMTNLLVSRLMNESGQFASNYNINSQKLLYTEKDFETQMIALKAVAKAALIFKFPPHAVSAIEAYHYLNNKLWDSATGFYKVGGLPNSQHVAMAINTLSTVLPLITEPFSKDQLNRLLRDLTTSLKKSAY